MHSQAVPQTMPAPPQQTQFVPIPAPVQFSLPSQSHPFSSVSLPFLGNGTYGRVYKATDSDGNPYAIKKSLLLSNVDSENALREIKILRAMEHPHLVSLKSVARSAEHKSAIDLKLELLSTDLHKIIYHSTNVFADSHLKYILYQLLSVVNYLHSAGILHRDIKPGNVLINKDTTVKLCDFGQARSVTIPASLAQVLSPAPELKRELTEKVQTPWYRSPEVLLGEKYGSPADMWGLGCILAESMMLLKEYDPRLRLPLFFQGIGSVLSGNATRENPNERLNVILKIIGKPSAEDIQRIKNDTWRNHLSQLPPMEKINFKNKFPGADPLAIDLLERLLTFNPEKRITAQEALEHPFLKDAPLAYDLLAGLKEMTFDSTFSSFVYPCGALTEKGETLASYYDYESKPKEARPQHIIAGKILEEIEKDNQPNRRAVEKRKEPDVTLAQQQDKKQKMQMPEEEHKNVDKLAQFPVSSLIPNSLFSPPTVSNGINNPDPLAMPMPPSDLATPSTLPGELTEWTDEDFEAYNRSLI